MSDSNELVKNVSEALLRQDGWENLFTQLGIQGKDSRVSGQFQPRDTRLNDAECIALYETDWAAERYCLAVAEDAVKAWFEVDVNETDKEEDELEERLETEHQRLQSKVRFQDALMWARVLGGAALLIGADDGQETDQPLNLNNIRSIKFLHLFDRRWVLPGTDWVDDVNDPQFGLPLTYRVTPPNGGVQTTWHNSRVLRFVGRPVTADKVRSTLSWGLSYLETPYDTLRNFGQVMDGSASACQSFVQGTLKIKDLAVMLSGKREDEIMARYLAFKMGLSMTGLAMIDADFEEYTRLGMPITGLPEMLTLMQKERTGALRMPESKLYGNQQGKLAGASEDTKTWDAYVSGYQERNVMPALRYLTKLLFLAKEGPFKGQEPDNWKLCANELSPRDESAEVEMGLKHAQTADLLYKAGAIEPSEMRSSAKGFKLNPDISQKIEEADLAAKTEPPEPGNAPEPPNPAGAPGAKPVDQQPEPKPKPQ